MHMDYAAVLWPGKERLEKKGFVRKQTLTFC